MTSDTSSFDAYRSPTLPEAPYAPAPTSGRPGLLTTLCVLAIVLGALGILNSFLGVAGAVGGKMLQSAMQPKAGAGISDDMQKAQEEFQANVNAVQDKYLWATIPALGFRFIAALLLLIGGIKSLSLQEPGRKVLLTACAVAVVFEILHAILQSVLNLDMMTAVNSYVEKLGDAMPSGQNDAEQVRGVMGTIVKASIIGGLVLAYFIALLKIALYVFGLIYLRRDRIRALFIKSDPAAAALSTGP
jgi:hypothetical protein